MPFVIFIFILWNMAKSILHHFLFIPSGVTLISLATRLVFFFYQPQNECIPISSPFFLFCFPFSFSFPSFFWQEKSLIFHFIFIGINHVFYVISYLKKRIFIKIGYSFYTTFHFFTLFFFLSMALFFLISSFQLYCNLSITRNGPSIF